MSDSENRDGPEEQFKEYAADICKQLALIADGFGLDTLGYLLTMVALEARHDYPEPDGSAVMSA
jgi:hypothetical protein